MVKHGGGLDLQQLSSHTVIVLGYSADSHQGLVCFVLTV